MSTETKTMNEETKVEDANITQEIKLSSGVEFTQEELAQMDPTVRAKLEKVKIGDANFTTGYNQKVAELNALKAQLAQAPAVTAAPATPAPKADEAPVMSPTDLYVYGKMTEEKYAKSKTQAIAMFGEKLVGILTAELQPLIDEVIAKGEFQTNFDAMWTNAYAQFSMTKPEVLNAFVEFKSGQMATTQVDLEAQATAAAQKKILEAKAATTTGLPAGGAAAVTAPVPETKPRSFAEAKARAKARIQAMKEQIK